MIIASFPYWFIFNMLKLFLTRSSTWIFPTNPVLKDSITEDKANPWSMTRTPRSLQTTKADY